MKYFVLIACLIGIVATIQAQKHEFGIKIGIQRHEESGIGINSDTENMYFNNNNRNQPYLGVYYRHRLDKWISLEAAPIIYQEILVAHYSDPNSFLSIQKNSTYQTSSIYLPILLRLDLGHKLSFTVGGGGMLVIRKKRIDSDNLPTREKKVFDELELRKKSWPINGELGLSYGFGRFAISGKYVFRASKIFDDIIINDQTYPIDLRIDAFSIDLSYKLF